MACLFFADTLKAFYPLTAEVLKPCCSGGFFCLFFWIVNMSVKSNYKFLPRLYTIKLCWEELRSSRWTNEIYPIQTERRNKLAVVAVQIACIFYRYFLYRFIHLSMNIQSCSRFYTCIKSCLSCPSLSTFVSSCCFSGGPHWIDDSFIVVF